MSRVRGLSGFATLFSIGPKLHVDESFYAYTSGRWLYNEAEQLAARRVEFDVEALKDVATKVVDARNCLRMTKTHEGSFNKIFLLEFDNGADLLAKIPTSLIPPFHTTASEVATMEYTRAVLSLPVPRVLAWSARADKSVNPVGAEYILMEKAEGDLLSTRWGIDKTVDAGIIATQVVAMEDRFTMRPFSQIGSLYYKEDVSPALQARPLYAPDVEPDADEHERFRIGPLVDCVVWRGSRAALHVDRGPWPDTASYLRALIRIEQEWLARYATPFASPFHQHPNGSPELHIKLLEYLYTLVPYITAPPVISTFVPWHTDLHSANIFVESKTDKPGICGVIDWQGMSVLPLYLNATLAEFFCYKGTNIEIPPGLNMPTYRVPLESAPPEEQERLKDEYQSALRFKMYSLRLKQVSVLHYASRTYEFLENIVPPILQASRTWFEGSDHLRESLIQIVDIWEKLDLGVPCPVEFSESEREVHRVAYQRRTQYEAKVQELSRQLELGADGWVRSERFAEVQKKNRQLMAGWDEVAEGGPYPFQDGAPSYNVGS